MNQHKTVFSNSVLILLLLSIVFTTNGQLETYEPVGLVCHGECDCQNKTDYLLLNCTNRGMKHVLAQWPTNSQHIIASFNWNNIEELQQLPTTDATISVSFSHCGIQTLASALFINAIGVEFFDLSWNKLTGREIRGDTFRGRYNNMAFEPINLRFLDLSHNNIQSLTSSTFEHTPKLEYLNLNHNPLGVLDLQTTHAISSVLSLQTIKLVNTSLSTIPIDVFSRLNKLRDVDLSQNHFKHVPEALQHRSATLKVLKFDDNPVQHLEEHDFIGLLQLTKKLGIKNIVLGLHNLKKLSISRMNELEKIFHNTFVFLPNLKFLNCSNNRKLYDIHQHAFGVKNKTIALEELYLTNNNLETIDHNLLNWMNLSILELSGNRWRCDCEMYQTITKIQENHVEQVNSAAMCSLPAIFAGTSLKDLNNLQKACHISLETKSVANSMILRTTLIISVVLLILLAFFVFWKVLVKCKSIRSINTLYPVMYVSAPTVEN